MRTCIMIVLLLTAVPVQADEWSETEMRKGVIIDFSADGNHGRWQVVNDGVMGGLSRSEFVTDGEAAGVFRGNVSLANNGGFASVRTVPGDYGLDGFDGVAIKVRGDGKRYSFRLRMDNRFDGVAWKQDFDTEAGEWMTVWLPFAGFEPTWRGRRVPNAPALDPDRIRQFGLLIADKQVGPFRIEVGEIAGYAGDGQEE